MWDIVRPLLPVRDLRIGGGVRKYGDRLVLGSIFYVLRSGCQWRMLPQSMSLAPKGDVPPDGSIRSVSREPARAPSSPRYTAARLTEHPAAA
jgi:hypothetical protein